MVDAEDLKSSPRKGVRVRIPPFAFVLAAWSDPLRSETPSARFLQRSLTLAKRSGPMSTAPTDPRASCDRREFLAAAATLASAAVVSRSAPPLKATAPAQVAQDPLGVRADFPITANRTYLNSAYITPNPRQVVQVGQAFMASKAEQSLKVGDLLRKVDDVRGQFARLVNAAPEEIGVLYTTSEGENLVANSVDWKAGDNVVIDELHYEAEFVIYRQLEARRGVELRIVRHREGAVYPADFEPHVNARTRLVSVAWVSHQNGFRHDMRPIADIAHAHGALCYADAIQAIGMFPVDVRAAGVDVMTSGTYKWLLGGFGSAPFFVNRAVADRIRPDRYGSFSVAKNLPDHHFELHKTTKQYEYATLPFAEVYQLEAGIAYLERVGVARIEEHTVSLGLRIQDGLLKQGHRLFTPPANRSSIVTFYTGPDANAVRTAFESAKVDVTVRDGQVRVSAALFNSTDDVDRFLDVTARLRG